MQYRPLFFALPFLAGLHSGCAPQASRSQKKPSTQAVSPVQSATLSGTVTYRQRSALPPDAKLEVSITDISPGIMTAAILGQTTVPTQGSQVPIAFELGYDPTKIVPDHDYGVKAVIRAGNRILFSNPAPYPVITKGRPSKIELILQPGE